MGSVALLIAVLIGGLGIYNWSQSALTEPATPDWHGQALLFLSRPGTSVTVHVRVTEQSWGDVEYHFVMSTLENVPVDELPYTLVLAGITRPETHYPSGERRELENGCPVGTVNGLTSDVSCETGHVGDTFPDVGWDVDVQLVKGTFIRQGERLYAQVTISSGQPVSASGSSRKYFALPMIGTSHVPDGFESEISFDPLGHGERLWVPLTLGTIVDYRKLEVTERVDNVAPDLAVPGQLTWATATDSNIRAVGSVVDTEKEAQGQTTLFLSGVALGVLGGFVAPLLGAAFRATTLVRVSRGARSR